MRPLRWLATSAVAFTTVAGAAESVKPARAAGPNILVILADDMGYGDLGCMGSEHLRTPHLDALASRGMRFTQAYVPSAVCSPSRAGILTGRDPRRFGYEGNLNKNAESYAANPALLGLPESEITMADHLREAGYSTALIGKWHQGVQPQFHPNRRGFDHFVGMLGGGHDYFPDPNDNQLERNGAPIGSFSSPYLTDFLTDEGLAWLTSEVTAPPEPNPWFLFMSYTAPHTPMQATDEDLDLYGHIEDDKRRTYAAMVHALDRGVGQLVAHLEATDKLRDTLIVFFSDNGGAANNASWNGPLAGSKGTLREGGIRVPFIVSWPGTLPEGETSELVVSALDLAPTFLSAAEAKPAPERPAPSHEDDRNRRRYDNRFGRFDGRDLLPVLRDGQPSEPRRLHWRLQGQSAVRIGDLKLVKLAHRPAQLFAPAGDPGEAIDLASERPGPFAELFDHLGVWESTLPTVPIWDSSPFWWGDSARLYDNKPARPEPN